MQCRDLTCLAGEGTSHLQVCAQNAEVLCRAWQLISPVESGSVFQVYGGHYHLKHLFCSQDDVPANIDFSG